MTRLAALAAVLVVAAPVARVGAQAPTPGRGVFVGVSGGAMLANAAFGVGGHIAASAGTALRGSGVALRADGAFGLFPGPGPGAQVHLVHVTGNVVVPLRAGRVRSYALAGAGLYTQSEAAAVQAGWNVGLGAEWGRRRARPFAEVRAHRLRPGPRRGAARLIIPLAVGVRF